MVLSGTLLNAVSPVLLVDNSIADEIMEEIECKILFSIPVPFIEGGIPVYESTVVTWIIMGVITLICALLTRKMELIPGKRQMLVETGVKWIRDFVLDNLGEEGLRYCPYLGTVLIYIGVANIIGMFGLKPPTKDLSVTAGLALMSIVLIQMANIRHNKVGGYFKSFTKPSGVMLFMNVLELGIKPLSLCLRLFGNVIAAFIIMKLIEMICPVVLPLVGSAYFDLFDGFLQAYIFFFLTTLYISEATEEE